jgi:hypothetical protein
MAICLLQVILHVLHASFCSQTKGWGRGEGFKGMLYDYVINKQVLFFFHHC